MNPCVSCTSTFYQVATLGARRTDDGGGGEDSVVSHSVLRFWSITVDL